MNIVNIQKICTDNMDLTEPSLIGNCLSNVYILFPYNMQILLLVKVDIFKHNPLRITFSSLSAYYFYSLALKPDHSPGMGAI